MDINTSVAIVGGSLNGLTTALLLSHQHVPCVVVERHSETTLQYKFRGISPRSMEIYRSLGIEREVRARDLIEDKSAWVARMKNLADGAVSWQGLPWSDMSDFGSTPAATCDQDQLEPILRLHAERLGARMLFNTELLSFTQDDDGVTLQVRDRASSALSTIRASYMVAADGAQSSVRDRLELQRHGPGVLQHWMNVIFETDLPETLEGRPVRSIFVTDINGTFVPRGDGRWLMAVQYTPEKGQRPEDFTDDRCRDLIRRGAGRAVEVKVVDARPWEAAASVADSYQKRRVFLVGDSAHVMPPTGGFGGNTGIQDAHNLAWKLAAVTRGAAGTRLLDTYDQERRPVADATMAQALARLQAWFKDPSAKLPPPVPIVKDDHVLFGYCYPTGAFVMDEPIEERPMFEDPRTPTARPGARAPQLMVEHDGRRVSTIDLFNGQWTLVAGPSGDAWLDAARLTPVADLLHLSSYRIGHDLRDVNSQWTQQFGLEDDGAVVIRPDGFIAWRARNAEPKENVPLSDVLERLTLLKATADESETRA